MIKSNLIHAAMTCQPEPNGEIIIGGITPFNMIVRSECETGICGEGWSEWHFVPANTDLDSWGHEIARLNAATYGHGEDEEEDEEQGYSEENISCTIYWYNPAISDGYINGGSPNGEILEWLLQEGLMTLEGRVNYYGNVEELFHIRDEWDVAALLN